MQSIEEKERQKLTDGVKSCVDVYRITNTCSSTSSAYDTCWASLVVFESVEADGELIWPSSGLNTVEISPKFFNKISQSPQTR